MAGLLRAAVLIQKLAADRNLLPATLLRLSLAPQLPQAKAMVMELLCEIGG